MIERGASCSGGGLFSHRGLPAFIFHSWPKAGMTDDGHAPDPIKILIFLSLSQLVYLLPLALDLELVLIYLPLLLILRLFLTLELITDEGSCAQSKSSTDSSSYARVTNSSADEASCSSTSERSDSRSLFPR